MTYSLKIAGANFTYAVDRVAPHIDRASGLWYFGNDTEARTNLLTGDLSTVVGSPSVADGIATLSGVNGYDTGISITSGTPFTFITVASTVAQSAFEGYMGTWHSGINSAKLYSNMFLAAGGGNRATISIPASNNLAFKAGTFSAASSAIYAHDGATMLNASGTGGSSLTNTLRIGAMGGPSVFTCAAAMLFKEQLNASEINDVYEYLKFKLAKQGVNIL